MLDAYTRQGDSARVEEIEAGRQALRDLPAGIDLDGILSPEDLEAFEPPWPELS